MLRRCGCTLVAWAALVLLATAAEEKGEQPGVGKVVTANGTVAERPAPGKPWRVLAEGGTVPAGGVVMGLPGARIDSANGAVRLTFLTNLNKDAPHPILDAAISPNRAPDVDLDVTLDRGRIDLTNLRKDGPARVRLRFHDQTWEAVLEDPGTRIAVLLYGRWRAGTQFTTTPGPKDVPDADLLLLVRKGSVRLTHDGREHLMTAPPGPALIHWSNSGSSESPERLDKLPTWASADTAGSERAKKKQAMLERFRRLIADKSPEEAVEEFLASEDPDERAIAVVFLGATDNLQELAKVLSHSRQRDVWDRAVQVVRHWLGRRPGQDLALYNKLIAERGFSPVEAATLLQLLHSFDETQLAQPETYHMLIQYLGHDKLGIRGLAYWHLYRLVPAGRKIGYDPLDDKAARDRARAEWKKLIPPGELPPRETPDKSSRGVSRDK
jgi:hypothetical protein